MVILNRFGRTEAIDCSVNKDISRAMYFNFFIPTIPPRSGVVVVKLQEEKFKV